MPARPTQRSTCAAPRRTPRRTWPHPNTSSAPFVRSLGLRRARGVRAQTRRRLHDLEHLCSRRCCHCDSRDVLARHCQQSDSARARNVRRARPQLGTRCTQPRCLTTTRARERDAHALDCDRPCARGRAARAHAAAVTSAVPRGSADCGAARGATQCGHVRWRLPSRATQSAHNNTALIVLALLVPNAPRALSRRRMSLTNG